MPIDPKPNEDREDFLSRCIPKEIDAGKPRRQAIAICSSIYAEGKFNNACMEVYNKCESIFKE